MVNVKSAYDLMHEGILTLAKVEANGMRIDVDLLNTTIEKVERKVDETNRALQASDEWKVWRDKFGSKASLGSRPQLGQILFEVLGHRCDHRTKTGRPVVDEGVLSKIDLPFVKKFLMVEKLKKVNSTFLKGIRRELVGEYLRPSFNLNLARSFRSSCDHPNFQNFPVRDKRIGKLVRSCFIPRNDHVLVEIDYSGLEVRIAACYHKDPVMLEYIKDPTKDMHRDMAAECFLVPTDQVSKDMRYCAKNMFVFPQFYGDYFVNCARNLWGAVDGMSLETTDGRRMSDLLSVYDSESFEDHIKEVERKFWDERFSVYRDWKEAWWEKYLLRGRFRMRTGFTVKGVYSRNDVINYPVQGSAFHCLLWSLIRLQTEMEKRGMKSVIIGQIHDSIVADVLKSELNEFLQLARQIMTEEIRESWDWIIVPLEVEAEVGETNWWEKKEVLLN